MIADLKLYPVMKDSGVSWLGGMPEYWDASRVKNLAISGYKTFVDGDWIESPFITSEGIRLIQTGNIGVGSYLEKGFRYISEGTFKAFRCTEFQPNDVLICRLGEPVGRACLAPKLGVRMITSVDVCILKPRHDVLPSFVVYTMSSPQYLSWVNSLVRGSTRDRVSRSMLGSFVIPLPPLSEQSAVVRYLDYIDRRIRKYIRVKQKLIKLLEEQKQAIIHCAVTRGLNPNVRLKPSGVEWLGDIPEHWEVMLNQRIFKEEIRTHDGLPETQLSLSQRDGLIATIDMQERSLQTSSYDNWKVTIPGDLVLNRFKAHLGVFFASTLRGIVSFHYGVFSPRRQLIAKYFELLYHTRPYKIIYAGRSNGMTVGLQNLSNQNFYNVRSIVPPIQEQADIVAFAEMSTERLRDVINTAHREISLLHEYRTRLIADVVTGKLDVRKAAGRLPDEAEEPELLDGGDAMSAIDDEPVEDLNSVQEEVGA